MTDIFIDDFYNKFHGITKKPEKFLSAPEKLINNIKELIKETYDFTKKEETIPISESLPELIVDNFDIEQIWQQLELQNESILTEYLSSVSKLVAAKERLWFVNNDDESDQENNDQEVIDEENENDSHDIEEPDNVELDDTQISDDNLSDNDVSKAEETKISKQNNKSVVDDDFFKLDEMEQFLKREEQQFDKQHSEESDDEESVDLFEKNSEDIDDDSGEDSEYEMNPKYDDFFGESQSTESKKRKKQFADESGSDNEYDDEEPMENKKQKVKFEDELENEYKKQIEEKKKNFKSSLELREERLKRKIEDIEETAEEEKKKNFKSSLELREERLKRKIEDIEETALEEKPWQLKGEVTADKRPQNSLLEEIVDFDLTVRPAPVITEETTMRLEDVIKQRIKDKVWDDVERKTKLVETPFEYKKKLMLDQEKSKQSLAQIYENDYLKLQESLDPNSADKPEEEPKEHTEIKSMMKSLFNKLDALSNFHFTPKTVAPELRIISNLPAINMEEVAPVAASDAALLAPEEVKNKTKGNEIGKSERTTTDKKRERRQKKMKQQEHSKAKIQKEKLIEKIKPGLGNKYSKQKVAKLLEKVTKDRNVDKMDETTGNKSLKSSTAFFSQLQDEVKGHIKSKSITQNKKSKQIFTAKKLKL